jgi:hypothetical protein
MICEFDHFRIIFKNILIKQTDCLENYLEKNKKPGLVKITCKKYKREK